MTLDAERTAEGGGHISTGAALGEGEVNLQYYNLTFHLNIVSLPGLAAEEEGGHAGEEAAEDAAEEAGLVEVLRVAIDEAALAAGPAQAHTAVPAAVQQALVPSSSHNCLLLSESAKRTLDIHIVPQ